MPLPLPLLDDRTYQDLLDELIESLPANAPEWTDYNASDPGITLLELLSYTCEQSLYRLDRIGERQSRAFLRLIGAEPRNAQVAVTPVQITPKAGAAALDLPAGVQVANPTRSSIFQTGTAFHVSDAQLKVALTVSGGRILNRTSANDALNPAFAAFGARPQPGDAFYLGFDRPLGDAGTRIRLFVFGESATVDWDTWRRLRDAWLSTAIHSARHCPCVPGSRPWTHYAAHVVWEFYDGQGWQRLPGVKDLTRALSLSGPVRWRSPDPATHHPGGVSGSEGSTAHDALYFVRCRLSEGAYDCPPMLRGVWINAVVARHAVDVGTVTDLGVRGTGQAWQQFRLPRTPVVPGSTRLTLLGPGGALNEVWHERADFDRSGSHARDYVLEAATGTITFGDGREGRVLHSGTKLRGSWQIGGGAAGNVRAGTMSQLPLDAVDINDTGVVALRSSLNVLQPIDAVGGADAEAIAATKARGFRIVTESRCATTLGDLERIACSTPGVPMAFAYAVAEHHPQLGCLPAAGCVTLVVVPKCVKTNRDPTPAMCAAVAVFVAPCRPIALEIHVTGPRYTVVTVTAALVLERNASCATMLAQARSALDRFLDPLAGGPNYTGWPVGRSVYRSEILALLDAIPGVDYVADLTLTADQGAPAHCGELSICAYGLVFSGVHILSASEGTPT